MQQRGAAFGGVQELTREMGEIVTEDDDIGRAVGDLDPQLTRSQPMVERRDDPARAQRRKRGESPCKTRDAILELGPGEALFPVDDSDAGRAKSDRAA
jgi:hypothetical protein